MSDCLILRLYATTSRRIFKLQVVASLINSSPCQASVTHLPPPICFDQTMCMRTTNISFVIFWPIPCVLAPSCLLPYICKTPKRPMTALLTWQQMRAIIIITLYLLTVRALMPILRLFTSSIHYRLSLLRGEYGARWWSQHSCWCWRLPLILY